MATLVDLKCEDSCCFVNCLIYMKINAMACIMYAYRKRKIPWLGYTKVSRFYVLHIPNNDEADESVK